MVSSPEMLTVPFSLDLVRYVEGREISLARSSSCLRTRDDSC